MSRLFPLCLLLFSSSFSPLAFAQDSATTPPQTQGVQVVYLIGSSTITTYNVDPQTLYPSQVGDPFTVNAVDLDYSTASVIAAPNDRVLYIIGYESSTSQPRLMVYATDTSGAPENPALQVIPAAGLYQVIMDPQSSFLYAMFQGKSGTDGYTRYTVRGYAVDYQGKLGNPQTVAAYNLSSDPSGEDCAPYILGFNSAGTVLYDEVGCGYPGGISGTYNERSVDLKTGALGADAQIFHWTNAAGGIDTVQFVGDHVFIFRTPDDYQTGINSVDIYALASPLGKPLLQCTASMLESCGNATGTTHPSGKYIFMSDSQDFTEIDRVDLNEKKIVDTGNYIPYGFGSSSIAGQFSPDGTLVYATGASAIQIYGFNVATSEVTPGGAISVPNYDLFLATERD